jgi:hypothetical protein
MKKHIIFESTGYWTTETWEDAVNYYKQAYGEIDEQQILEMIYDDCNRAFEDERVNLNQQIDGEILVIANIGRWNGRFNGYKIIDNNLKEILSNFGNVDEIIIFSDGKNIRAEGCHHDGTNYYLFREIKDGVNIDNLLNDIYDNKAITSARLSYYTKSLVPYVNNIYGWK